MYAKKQLQLLLLDLFIISRKPLLFFGGGLLPDFRFQSQSLDHLIGDLFLFAILQESEAEAAEDDGSDEVDQQVLHGIQDADVQINTSLSIVCDKAMLGL